MRVFVGIDITDIGVVESIHSIQSKIHARPTKLTNIHLTLHFLGEITRDTMQKVARTMTTIKFSRFDMRLVGLGVFSKKRPSVIWIGTDEQGQKMISELADNIHKSLVPLGVVSRKFVPEKFVPHVTVFRIKERIPDLNMLEPYKNKDFGVQHVSNIKLKESQAPKSSNYLDLQEVTAI